MEDTGYARYEIDENRLDDEHDRFVAWAEQQLDGLTSEELEALWAAERGNWG